MLGLLTLCQAQAEITPEYTTFFDDDVMIQNGDWTQAPANADSWSLDEYERPTDQSYESRNGGFATKDTYFSNLDLEHAAVGHDDTYLYVRLDLVGLSEIKDGSEDEKGLEHVYRFRINTDDGGKNGYVFTTENPTDKQGTSFGTETNSGYQDANGDADRDGNGYEKELFKEEHLYARIDPTDNTRIEFALKYNEVDLDLEAISSIVFEANKGMTDISNYPFNKEYSSSESGSPYSSDGLQNIYQLDTLTEDYEAVAKAAAISPTGSITVPDEEVLQGVTVEVDYSITPGTTAE